MSQALNVVMNYANEDVAAISKHWIIFLKTTKKILIRIFIVMLIYIKGKRYLDLLADKVNSLVPAIPFEIKEHLLTLIGIYLIIKTIWDYVETYIEYKTVGLSVNNIQIKGKSGLLDVGVINASLEKVSSVEVFTPFWGRFLNYGTIRISLEEKGFTMFYMVKAERFQEAIILLQEAQKEGRDIRQAERHAQVIEAQTKAQVQAISAISTSLSEYIEQKNNIALEDKEIK